MIKKQLILLSVVFREDETYGESASAAIDHRLFNEDGIMEWDVRILEEDSLSADISKEDLRKAKGNTVTIQKADYESLLDDSDKLSRLEAYGVDNWHGYSDAMSDSEGIFEDEEEEWND